MNTNREYEGKQNFTIQQCANGFILRPAGNEYGDMMAGKTYCFNTPEDMAKFLRKFYSNSHGGRRKGK